ncbi:MAG: flagellar hook-associated protein FlgK [Lachnospiraceae bacterium]|nr:flagellar hook-associated protein FlgK [Lachnospiraceae bacterium]
MGSQFTGLMIGYSGIQAYQAAENTVANNAANVDTKGYTKQVVNRTAAAALHTFTTYGMQGMGVNINSIDQLRNVYFDLKYRANEADLGRYTAINTYMNEIDTLFKDTSTIPGFETVYTENFFAGLEELAKEPGATSARSSFLGKAESLTDYFNTMSLKLEEQQLAINSEIKSVVNRINNIASEISVLNQQINIVEFSGQKANELRDKRNLLIDELSVYVDVKVQEDPIINMADPDNQTGAMRYRVSIGNGSLLVDMYDYNPLELRSRTDGEIHNQNDLAGLYDIYWEKTGVKFSPTDRNLSGQLKGLLEIRDGNNNDAVSGTFDSHTSGEVTFTVGDEYESVDDLLSKLNISSQGMVKIAGVEHIFDGFTIDVNTDGTFKFTLKNVKYRDLSGGWTAEGVASTVIAGDPVVLGDQVDYQGIPYYQAQMNQWVRKFAFCFNGIEREGADLYGDQMTKAFFVSYDRAKGKQIEPDQASSTTPKVIVPSSAEEKAGTPAESSLYYRITAFNFEVNKDIVKDPRLMSTTYSGGVNDPSGHSEIDVSNDDLVKDLIKIKDDRSRLVFRGAKSTEFLSCILADIALNCSSSKTFVKNCQNIELTIDNQKMSYSGVDQDEEALDLVKFQNAYNLNAKIIQTMTEIYDKLIQQTGV